jgi:hypothetical protein
MDRRQCRSVRRCDFYEASTAHVTLEMRRTMTRGDLHERFRSSAAEMTLDELLGRAWPTLTDGDRKIMGHWAKLRDAYSVVSTSSFQGTLDDLKRIFDLLDVECSQKLSIGELVRARILTKDECQKVFKDLFKDFNRRSSAGDSCDTSNLSLSFDKFCFMTKEHLSEKYVRKTDKSSWALHFRSAFQKSQAAAAKLQEDRQEYDALLGNTLSPKKMSPKFSRALTKGADVRVGLGGHALQNQGSVVMAC